jgi:hypothetical protein
MNNQKHIVIFSHGFGTKKDDMGLFAGGSGISDALNREGIETILFDYNTFNPVDNSMIITPLDQQVRVLKKVVEETIQNNPGAVIDIIGHSQGCLAPAILLAKNIRRFVCIAPSLDTNNQRMVDFFMKRPNTKIDFDGDSSIERSDGTLSIIPSQYWKDRDKAEPIQAYNEFSKLTKIVIIKANQDKTLGDLDTTGLSNDIVLTSLDGDHNFNGEDRVNLVNKVKEIICK